MRCDACGWRVSRKAYDGKGECFCCWEGLMIGDREGMIRSAPVRKKRGWDGKIINAGNMKSDQKRTLES